MEGTRYPAYFDVPLSLKWMPSFQETHMVHGPFVEIIWSFPHWDGICPRFVHFERSWVTRRRSRFDPIPATFRHDAQQKPSDKEIVTRTPKETSSSQAILILCIGILIESQDVLRCLTLWLYVYYMFCTLLIEVRKVGESSESVTCFDMIGANQHSSIGINPINNA